MQRLSLLLFATLAGCTQSAGNFPSLLPRAIETRSNAEPVRPAPVVKPNAVLDAKVAELSAQAETAYKNFTQAAQAAEARIAVARGTARGSEPWLNAQTALADLDGTRTGVLSALADLERLTIDRGVAGEPPYPALEKAVAAARAHATEAEQRSTALEAALAAG